MVALLALWLGTDAGIARDPGLLDAAREGDLERIVAGIPAGALPVGYAALLVLGLLGTPLARTWWPRVWPPETAADYAGRTGYWAACVVRFLAFTLVFLPLTALVATPWSLGGQVWALVRGPLRGLGRMAAWAAWAASAAWAAGRRRAAARPPTQDREGGQPAQPGAGVAAQAPPVPSPSAPAAFTFEPPAPAPPPMPVPPATPPPAPAFIIPPPVPPPPPAERTPSPLSMPPPMRAPAAPPPSAPPRSPPSGSPPSPPRFPSPRPSPPALARAKRPPRDEPKPARSWIANLPRDEDI